MHKPILTVKIYKANLKTELGYIVIFLILLGVTIFLTSKLQATSWILFSIFCLLFLLYSLLTSRVSEIQLDNSNRTLIFIYKNYFNLKKRVKYNLDKIEFTYKKQSVSKYSGIKNVCVIYYSDKRITQVIPERDGWDDDEVSNFVHGLIQADVKKKFVGYNLKDAET